MYCSGGAWDRSITTLPQELRTSRARPRACHVQSPEPPETLVCGGSGSGPVISLSLSLSEPREKRAPPIFHWFTKGPGARAGERSLGPRNPTLNITLLPQLTQ